MPWRTPTTMLDFYDARTVAELSVDTDTPTDPVVADTAVIQAHLDAAQQKIEAAAAVGKRFSPPFDPPEVGELLGLLQSQLAFFTLQSRRGKELDDIQKYIKDAAEETVTNIQNGSVIPGLLKEAQANAALQVKLINPTTAQRLDRELISDVSLFFPRTGDG